MQQAVFSGLEAQRRTRQTVALGLPLHFRLTCSWAHKHGKKAAEHCSVPLKWEVRQGHHSRIVWTREGTVLCGDQQGQVSRWRHTGQGQAAGGGSPAVEGRNGWADNGIHRA